MANSTNWVKQSLRLLQRELRRGELTIVCLAIVLAVATVFSLSGFSAHIKKALITNSTSFIAADRVLQTGRPINQAVLDKSSTLGLDRAEQIQMSSMVFSGEKMQLAELRVVSDTYPLRGELLVTETGKPTDVQARHAPPIGHVWVEEKLLNMLDVKLGDSLEIGVKRFTIAGISTQIPDASFSVFTSGPNILLNIADIGQTELIQPGSRITYKYLFAGSNEDISAFEDWIKPQVNETQRWYDIQSRQSPLANALNRAEKYLSLASMLGIVLAAVAVAVASRRYGHRHQPTVAVFKAMGASRVHVRNLYLLHWTLLSGFSLALGLLVGYGLLAIGLGAMEEYLPVKDQSLSYYPFLVAIITGLICALVFAIAPLKSLIATSPLAVIRGFAAGTDKGNWFAIRQVPPFLALFALLMIFSRDFILSLSLLIGGLLVSGLLLLLGRLLMNAGRSVGSQAGKSWHLAMANLKRRASENSVQLVSFTIAIKLLLVILVMRNALITEWQEQLPDNAANRFLVNIASEQVSEVEAFIGSQGIEASGLYPVVRGRLSAINDEKIRKKVSKEEDNESDNGRRGVGRELNLTWREQLPKNNIILEGKWWQQDNLQPQVSIEQSIAQRLDVKLGDTLSFQIGSEEVLVAVTSVREVDWQSMQPNFFMIFNSQVLNNFPASYIASLYVPDGSKAQFQRFMSQYPTISMIDVDAMIGQLRMVIAQVSVAVEFILILVVLAGSLVLVAQVQASMEERERELAILRTLGAKGSLLRNSVLFEFVALGAIAGVMASMAMELGVYILQSQVFDMSVTLHPSYWALGIFAGASFVGFIGLLSCWRLLNMSSVTLIRRTM